MLLRLMREQSRHHRPALLVILALTTGQVALTMWLPGLSARIINQGVLTGDTAYIRRVGALMLVVALTQVVLAIVEVGMAAKVAMGVGRDLRAAQFHHVAGFSAQDVARFGSASLITRITNDVSQVQQLTMMLCTYFLAAPITVAVGIVLVIREDAALSLILVAGMPVLGVLMFVSIRRLTPRFQRIQHLLDRIGEILREQITGMRVVRAFVMEEHEAARFREPSIELARNSTATGRIFSMIFPFSMIVVNLSSCAAVWFGGHRIADGTTQIGSLVSFLTYLLLILTAVVTSSFIAAMAPRASVCAQRICEVLDAEPSVRAPVHHPVVELPGPASLEFRGVSFGYPGAEEQVLDDVSFTAVAGGMTAVIGSTGSGKTTLLQMVPRLFDVSAGAVVVNGVDVREVDLEVLWSRIGYVPQKPFLFSGTVRSNLLHAAPDASDDDCWWALEVAQATDFVAAMPGGLDATISQGGANVSGGQRQRLSIARAVIRRPSLYLFDDSFSALDLATDARLRAALEPVVAEAVTVVVAQRVSTIMRADRILVMDDGTIVGSGTHRELMDSCPTYLEIVESQLTREEAA